MHSPLIAWGRNAFLAGLVLVVVLVIPAAWFPFQLTKITAFALCALVALGLFVLGGGMREGVRAHGFKLALLVVLLPLVYLLSYLTSSDASVGLLGYGIEADTATFAVLAAASFLLSFFFFRTLRTARLLLTVLSITLLAAVAFQWLSVALGIIPSSLFADRSINLIGKWNDFGLFAGLFLTLLLVRVELMSATTLFRSGAIVVGLALVGLLGIVNFPLVWGLILVCAIALGIIKFITLKPQSEGEGMASETQLRRMPLLAGAMALIAAVFLFFGAAFNSTLTSIFPVSSLEVRPSFQSTMSIGDEARQGSPARLLLGTGPNTFGQQWLLYKPAEVNQTAFWNVDFNVGFSSLVTALSTVGILGLIAWLVPLLLILMCTARVMRYAVLSKEDKGIALALILASLFLFSALAFYVPSQNTILLSFAIFGATFGYLWRQGRESVAGETAPSRATKFAMSAFAFGLVVVVLLTAGLTVRRFISELIVNRGVVALQAGQTDVAFESAVRAIAIETTGNALRLAATAGAQKLGVIANDTSLPQEQARATFEAALGQTIAAGQQATALNNKDYRPYMILANVYDFLATLGVEGAYESALTTYAAAQERNPKNPGIPLSLARLEGTRGNLEGARTRIQEALTQKPNYTDAILFVVQLDVARNDIPSAIVAATAAAQTAPGVAPIWFQLGLLYYVAGQAQNAAAALEQAVALVPDYANAKYFLGLSYWALGRNEDAIAQFQDLAQSNPDNAEVTLILGNLRFGNPPFEGATPPVTPEPEARPSAPIEE